MIVFPEIPTRIRIYGDEKRGRELISFSRKKLSDMLIDSSFNELTTSTKRIHLYDGSILLLNINFGITTIDIFTPEISPEEIIYIKKQEKCLCNNSLAFANILARKEDVDITFLKSDYVARYDIEICTGDNELFVVELWYGYCAEAEIFEVGQSVYVTTPCISDNCVNESCFMDLIDKYQCKKYIILPVWVAE